MKKIFLLVLAVASAICSWAQTPAWQQELNRLDKEADQLYEQKRWRQLVANQQQYRKVIMAQPDSVRMEYSLTPICLVISTTIWLAGIHSQAIERAR